MKLLALSPGGRLHRDRVVDALRPDLTLGLAPPRLHKDAHYARRALGDRDAIVLKGEVVALFPAASLAVDALAFEAAADAALAADPVPPEECLAPLKLAGELLPDDLGESWLDEPRERLRLRVAELLRRASRTCTGQTTRRSMPPATWPGGSPASRARLCCHSVRPVSTPDTRCGNYSAA